VLAAATVLLRGALLVPRLAHWDAVNYALGLHVFDVAAHQPHPPGSPYFILLGRAALALVGDDNAALQLISVLASTGAVLAVYALARVLFDKPVGFVAALLLLTQPVFWGYGTTASAWTLLAVLSLGIGLLSAQLMNGRQRLVYPSALLLGLASGFRADAVVFLAPLWIWSLCKATPDWRRRSLAIALAAACGLAWLIPVAASAGGPALWSERLLALLPATDGTPTAEARQLAANTAIAFGTLAFTVGPALVVSLLVSRQRSVAWLGATLRSPTGVFLALWIVPAFVFLWLVDSTEPGHALVFVGALVALGAGLLTSATAPRQLLFAAVVAALQASVFLFAAPQADRPLAWTANSMLLNVTAPGLRQQQASLNAALQIVRSGFEPDDTLVVTLLGQDAYRFMMYYLPEYRVVRLNPQAQALLAARGRTQGNWTQLSSCLLDPSEVRHGIWVLSTPIEPGTIPEGAQPLSGADQAMPFQVWQLDPPSVPQRYLGFLICGVASSA
jgi:4-amino-4-deoxy-L-arabinose transferase-like glycosyltransferase